jgi:hypothetical protein
MLSQTVNVRLPIFQSHDARPTAVSMPAQRFHFLIPQLFPLLSKSQRPVENGGRIRRQRLENGRTTEIRYGLTIAWPL